MHIQIDNFPRNCLHNVSGRKTLVRPVVSSVTLLFEKLATVALKSLSFLVKAVLESVCQPHEVKQC